MSDRQKNILFWILQTGGWSLYAFVYFFLFRKVPKPDNNTDKILFLFTYVSGFIITVGLRYLFRYLRKKMKMGSRLFLLVFAVLLLACPFWYWADLRISMNFWNPMIVEKFWQNLSVLTLMRGSVMSFIPLLAWCTLYFGITTWMEWQREKKRTEEALHMAQKSQLEMLRYQLNPHFLFNSLNSARALIAEDPKAAREMITELSEFLRYSLMDKDVAFRPLSEELNALQHYLSIEKKRFEEKLLIQYEVEPAAGQRTVLSFLIHPVIENAIKYGMKTSETPLKLLIRATVEKGMLLIRICNSGHWIGREQHDQESGNGTGTGLENVRRRLENAYPERHLFRIEKEENRVCIVIGIHEQQ
jgi:hypothetical protein